MKIKRSEEKLKMLMSVEKIIETQNIKYVRFEQFDLHGIPRSKNVPIAFFKQYVEKGFSFYGGVLGYDIQTRCISDTGYGEERTYGDAIAVPDISTFEVLPWLPNTARIIVEPYWFDGTPLTATPRYMLKNILKQYEDLGYLVRIGFEFEFYLFDQKTMKPVYGSQPEFVTQYNNWNIDFTYYMMDKLQEAGYRILTQNAEQGPGQQEINLECRDGMQAVDEAQAFKYAIKEIAVQKGYLATFMTKPMIDKCASGAHIHINLVDKNTGKNVFLDEKDADGISGICRNFVAGILEHAPANMVFAAPTVNCYKRYKKGVCAPTTATWAFENRSVGVRIKGKGNSVHAETRFNCSAACPYVSVLSTLVAGLLGIRKNMTPPEPSNYDVWTNDNLKQLPKTMDEALAAFKADENLKQAYGDEFVKLVVAMKSANIKTAMEECGDYGSDSFNEYVSDWELEEFREIL